MTTPAVHIDRCERDDEDTGYRLTVNVDGEAGIHLIAAAPDLLGACKYALARFTHGPEAITNPNDAILDDLRAAIAKAEGGAE